MTRIYVGSFQPQFRTSLTMNCDINGKGDGIYAYEWDEENGELTPCGNTYAVINPARLCFDQKHQAVYAASDTNEFINWQAGTGGGIYAFDLLEDGKLKYRDSRSSCGVRAVDICCDASGEYVLCINEGSDFCTTAFLRNKHGRYEANIRRDDGCVTVFRTGKNGFQEVCDRVILPEGIPAHPIRMHLNAENYLFILNRSGKAVHVFQLNSESGKLMPIATLALRDCLRGLACHPILHLVYTSCPDNGEIKILRFDPMQKELRFEQKVFEEEDSHPGLLTISRDGRTLYAADEKTCEIKIYGISKEGKMVLLQRAHIAAETSGVHSIYDMQLTPGGKWLLCTDMPGDEMIAFRVEKDGRLGDVKRFPAFTPTGILMI